MGNIRSCCRDSASVADDREERSRILNDNCGASGDILFNDSTASATSQQDSISYGSFNNGTGSKILEQSALDKIYQKMASNVIDVAPGESMIIQQAEFVERQKAYQAKLNQMKTPRLPKHINNSLDTTVNSSASTKSALGTIARGVDYEPIAVDEIQLITEISLKSAQAIKSLKINSQEQVIAHFKP